MLKTAKTKSPEFWSPARDLLTLAIFLMTMILISNPLRCQTLKYDVESEGKKLGEILSTTRILSTEPVLVREMISSTHLRAKLLFLTVFSLESQDTSLIGPDGLLEHHSHAVVDDQVIILHGQRQGDTLLFQLHQENEQDELEIPVSSFDVTSLDSGFLVNLSPGQSKTLRVLQLETLQIVETKFTRLKDEPFTLSGKTVPCLVVKWSSQAGQGKSWYQKLSPDVLIREDGIDEDGAYSVILTEGD